MAGSATVLGATGFLGGRAARRLMEDGRPVRVAARRPERDGALLDWDLASPLAADLARPETLPPTLEGADLPRHLVFRAARRKHWVFGGASLPLGFSCGEQGLEKSTAWADGAEMRAGAAERAYHDKSMGYGVAA